MNKEMWFRHHGDEGDICVSTRVRFARNISKYPFPGRMSDEQARELISDAAKALAGSEIGVHFRLVDMEQCSSLERAALVERHIISPDLAEGGIPRAVLISEDESMSVMLNEEDHLRLQVLAAGLDVQKTLEQARKLDEVFDRELGYAFDDKLGYLTKCPTNIGTGMRVSVMLHLPSLTEAREIGGIISAAGGAGFTARGIYGEGSAAEGALYQFSNRITLGYTEDEVCERLERVARQIIERERTLRKLSVDRDSEGVEDKVFRAIGVLKYAKRIDTGEALRLLGEVRVGVSVGILPIDCGKLNELLWAVRASGLSLAAGKELTPQERDRKRAELLHDIDKGSFSI